MKIEIDFDEDVADIVVLKRLNEWYELCDTHFPIEDDRKYYQNLKQHLRAVINFASPEQIDD